MIWLFIVYNCTVCSINGRQSYRTFRIILVGDQLEGMKQLNNAPALAVCLF